MMYSDWTAALAGYLPETLVDPTSAAPFLASSRYNAVLLECIEYAENRIYQDPDFDFLATRLDATRTLTASVRRQTLPAATIVIEQLNVITPAGASLGDTGSTSAPVLPATVAFLNAAWPSPSYQGVPKRFARFDDNTIILGPVPDQAYTVEYYGTFQPAPLSSDNTSTPITENYPALFLAASMIFMSGYQKTFGALSGDPQQGMTWEQYYDELKKGVASQEARKKFQSSDWSSLTPATQATPPRA